MLDKQIYILEYPGVGLCHCKPTCIPYSIAKLTCIPYSDQHATVRHQHNYYGSHCKKTCLQLLRPCRAPTNLSSDRKKLDIKILHATLAFMNTVKPILNDHSQNDQKLVFKTNYHLMQIKSIAECSKRAFCKPSLSYHLSLRPSFCLF